MMNHSELASITIGKTHVTKVVMPNTTDDDLMSYPQLAPEIYVTAVDKIGNCSGDRFRYLWHVFVAMHISSNNEILHSRTLKSGERWQSRIIPGIKHYCAWIQSSGTGQNGDCLFSSITFSLNQIFSTNQDTLQINCNSLGIIGDMSNEKMCLKLRELMVCEWKKTKMITKVCWRRICKSSFKKGLKTI